MTSEMPRENKLTFTIVPNLNNRFSNISQMTNLFLGLIKTKMFIFVLTCDFLLRIRSDPPPYTPPVLEQNIDTDKQNLASRIDLNKF